MSQFGINHVSHLEVYLILYKEQEMIWAVDMQYMYCFHNFIMLL